MRKPGRLLKYATAIAIVAVLFSASLVAVVDHEDRADGRADNENSIILDSDAIVPLLIIIAIIIILAAYSVAMTVLFFDKSDGGGSDARAAAAENLSNFLTASINQSESYAQDEQKLIGFAESFFERMGEVTAAEQWSSGGSIDFDKILSESRAYEEYSTLMLNRMMDLSSIFTADGAENAVSHWANDSTYNGMGISLNYGGTQVVSDGSTLVQYCLGTMVTSTSADEVYLYDGSGSGFADTVDAHDGFLYATAPATIKSADTGQTYALKSGFNDVSTFPNGIYQLQSGVSYFGSIMQTYGADAASIYPAVELKAGSQTFYAIKTTSGLEAIRNGVVTNINTLSYDITDNGNVVQSVNLLTSLNALKTTYNASNVVFSRTLNAATAAWHVFDTAGESSILVSPSALLPNIENMDFTADQIYLIYMSSLQQASAFFKTAGDNFTADDVMISQDSLDLICHGTIYSDASKTIPIASGYFTPMCFLRDQAVMVGNTLFSQPGLAMFWTPQSDGTYAPANLVTLDNGNFFSIDSLTYRGINYDEPGTGITLHVIALPNLNGFNPTPGPVYPHITAGGWDLALIIMIIGCILLLLGMAVDDLRPLAYLGIVIVVIGAIMYFMPHLSFWSFLGLDMR